jgi:hypothetical protein
VLALVCALAVSVDYFGAEKRPRSCWRRSAKKLLTKIRKAKGYTYPYARDLNTKGSFFNRRLLHEFSACTRSATQPTL